MTNCTGELPGRITFESADLYAKTRSIMKIQTDTCKKLDSPPPKEDKFVNKIT